MKSNQELVSLKGVSLEFENHHDRTNSLKEFVINFVSRRKYVKKRMSTIPALKNIDFFVQEKERVGIIGLNGSGKSSLLKVVSGILKPTGGLIEIDGSVSTLIEIGAGFDPEFTGRENIYLNGYMLGYTKRQLKLKEQEIIDFAELGNMIDMPVKYYSSGMSVRLAFTIATSISPDIMVIDEMLSAGDAAFIAKAEKRINALIDKARALIVVSHDLNFISRICNRCLVMNKGNIVFDGTTGDALSHYHALIKNLESHPN